MTDITHEGHGPDTFEARLQRQAHNLRRLKVERGDPSLRRIAARAKQISSGALLPIATQNAAFTGARFVSVDKIMLLVRTLMSWDENGEEVPAPDRRDPVLEEWRLRWRATAELRPRRRTVAKDSVPGRPQDEPTGAQAHVPRAPKVSGTAEAARSVEASGRLRRSDAAAPGGFISLWYEPLTSQPVHAVAFSPDGHFLATASSDGSVQLWDPATQPPVGHLLPTNRDWPVLGLAFSPDGTLLATASRDSTVQLWDPATCAPVGAPLTGHSQPVLAAAFSPDGGLLATTGLDGTVRLWNPTTRASIGQPLTGHKGPAYAVVFSPDGSLLATASRDSTAQLWNPATRAPIDQPLTGHKGSVRAVAFSPDGTLLATAGHDGTVRLWNPATRAPVGQPLTGHKGSVYALAFSPGRMLATTGLDGTVRLWDPVKRTPIGQLLTHHSEAVYALAFSPDGTLLATASRDGRMYKAAEGGRSTQRWTPLPR
ncbi:WD40 repeat domain-containing protein [Streptomyces galbus]|uniref:WD40 repeat domain-containing protein n=1 Tax=Streptomyces galbus TaxID=33898 RepID=A0ABX1IB91_STRGB|nr:WD40 repeat domain-containing protein [Streptomyces galbus]NKQ22944.1 WD40 repeat domain-containing protein [Streptomyces galbus]